MARDNVKHGIRSAALPAGCSWLKAQLQSFRRAIRDELTRIGKPLGILQEAFIQSAMRHETRAQLAQRWLRIEGEGITLERRIALLAEIGRATDSRDKCLEKLGIEQGQGTIFTQLYADHAEVDAATDPPSAKQAATEETDNPTEGA